MRLPVPGPRDVLSALERGADQVEALVAAVPRALALLDRAAALLDQASAAVARADVLLARAGATVDRVQEVAEGAAEVCVRAGAVVDGAAVQSARVATLVDLLEPSLTTLQPTLETLAETTHPDEVRALVRLVDQLPALADRMEDDVLPVLTTLGSVAPDLHDLLNVSRELNEILGGIPGLGRIKRRVEEDEELGASAGD